MGIEQAFGLGREVEFIPVGERADYRPYQRRIAELEGKLAGTIEGYEKGIEELADVARQNKEVAAANRVVADVFKDVLRDFVAQGRMTRAEVNTVKDRLIKTLPEEEQKLICD